MLYLSLLCVCVIAAAGLYWRYRRKAVVPVEPRIVQAVLTVSSHKRVETARQIEAAMAEAVRQCMAEGVDINDGPTVRTRMLEARARVMGRSR